MSAMGRATRIDLMLITMASHVRLCDSLLIEDARWARPGRAGRPPKRPTEIVLSWLSSHSPRVEVAGDEVGMRAGAIYEGTEATSEHAGAFVTAHEPVELESGGGVWLIGVENEALDSRNGGRYGPDENGKDKRDQAIKSHGRSFRCWGSAGPLQSDTCRLAQKKPREGGFH